MLQRLQITCRFVSGVVHKAYHSQRNFKNCTAASMLLHFGKLTEMSLGAYSILLAQLMATLIHYTFTLPLSGLVDWSPFLERLLSAL